MLVQMARWLVFSSLGMDGARRELETDAHGLLVRDVERHSKPPSEPREQRTEMETNIEQQLGGLSRAATCDILFEGWCDKESKWLGRWRPRWLILFRDQHSRLPALCTFKEPRQSIASGHGLSPPRLLMFDIIDALKDELLVADVRCPGVTLRGVMTFYIIENHRCA